MMVLTLFVALLLALANGANDNFKGVATLAGSRTLSPRAALALGTASTLAGSVVAVFLARGLLLAFSGKGLVPQAVLDMEEFLPAVGLGAGFTVLLATRVGIPVSTTHALIGGLTGAGFVLAGSSLDISALGAKFLVPLATSPIVAATFTAVTYVAFRRVRHGLGLERESCVCVAEAPELDRGFVLAEGVATGVAGPMAVSTEAGGPSGSAMVGLHFDAAGCDEPGVRAFQALDYGHVLSAAAVSFARGINDTPKIAALAFSAGALDGATSGVSVGVAMAIGGWLLARRVADTLAWRITEMNAGQGFAANLVTAVLVIAASRFGLPVSTTHVSCGALFGLGLATGAGRTKTILSLVGAWVLTLPIAAALSACIALALV